MFLRTYGDSHWAESEPSRTWDGKDGEGNWLNLKSFLKGRVTASRSSSGKGCAKAPLQRQGGGVEKVTPLAVLGYCLGKAKSQAVSCAHFHMACMRRVKPMSFGFSRPLISRCFMMETNSLLLSSPLPRGRGKHRISGGLGTKTENFVVHTMWGVSPALSHQIQFS